MGSWSLKQYDEMKCLQTRATRFVDGVMRFLVEQVDSSSIVLNLPPQYRQTYLAFEVDLDDTDDVPARFLFLWAGPC